MTNKTEDKKLEEIEKYAKTQNNETNKYGKLISGKLLILITITFIVPYILLSIDRGYFNFDINDEYKFWFAAIIYVESFFIYFIKKLIPRINFAYIWAFLLIIILYCYHTTDGWGQLGTIILLFFTPLLGAISYFGSNLITAIILAIQRAIKKEKIYDDEMKKICMGLGIGLLILVWLFFNYKTLF